MSDKTCAERIDDHYDSEMETLRILWAGYCNDECPRCDGTGKRCNCDEENCPDKDAVCPTCDGECNLSEDTPEYGNLNEYGLSFDYCYSTRNSPGYFRYQLSWGGPSDEFRIYADKRGEYRWNIWKIEYWFMDWFDGAHKTLSGDDFKFMEELITGFFTECGSLDHEYEKAMENYEPEDDDEEEIDEEE
mgnify:FL=1